MSGTGLRRFSSFSTAACTDRVGSEPDLKNIGSEMEPLPMPEAEPVEVDEICGIEYGRKLESDSGSPLNNEQKLTEKIVYYKMHT